MLNNFFKKDAGLDSLLPYAALVDEGKMLLKSGGMCATYEIRGKDLSSSTNAEIGAISLKVSDQLKELGDGWMLHVDSVRHNANYYPSEEENFFPDPVSALIDASRRALFQADGNVFENKYYMTITYTAPTLLGKKYSLLFESILDKQKTKSKKSLKEKNLNSEIYLANFSKKVDEFINKLKINIYCRLLTSNEMLTHFHFCITGLKHKVELPIVPMYMDFLLASQGLVGGEKPKIGKKHIRVISISSLPNDLQSGILESLSLLPFESRFSTRFIHLDPAHSKKYIEDIRKDWDQSKMSFKAMLDDKIGGNSSTVFLSGDAVDMSYDANAAVNESQRNDVGFGFLSACIVLMNEDEELLEEQVYDVTRQLGVLSFPSTVETINAVEAYLGSLPALGYANIRKPLITTHNFAHLMPLTSIWSGDERHPNDKYQVWADKFRHVKTGEKAPPLLYGATSGNSPFRLSFHVADVGHLLLLGPTGMGKSALISLIIAQFRRYPESQVFLFDKKYSQFVLSNSVGGAHFDLAADDAKISFCPLAHLETQEEKNWACSWIEMLVEMQGKVPVTMKEQTAISNAIQLFARTRKDAQSRTLDDFMRSLAFPELSKKLEFYAQEYGYLFNGNKDVLSTNKFCVFEMDHLMDKGSKVVYPTLTYLFNMIEKRLDGSPTYIVIDEAWMFLSHPMFSSKINEWLRELRKLNCAVIFATQSLSDIKDAKELFNPIMDSCATKIFLPNPNAVPSNESTYETYKSFGLNENEIKIIARAQPKRQYYFKSTEGSRLFEILLDDISLSFVGVADDSSVKSARKCIQDHGDLWVKEWLTLRGVDLDWIEYYDFIKSKLLKKMNLVEREDFSAFQDVVNSDSYKRQLMDFSPEFKDKLNKIREQQQIEIEACG